MQCLQKPEWLGRRASHGHVVCTSPEGFSVNQIVLSMAKHSCCVLRITCTNANNDTIFSQTSKPLLFHFPQNANIETYYY